MNVTIKPPDRDAAGAFSADAFRVHRLREAVQTCRAELAEAKLFVTLVSGKAATAAARKAVGAASRALATAEAAVVAEEHGEAAAPAVRRQEIASATVVLREPMVEMRGKRAELTPALERLFHRDTISRAEYVAGRRYREAWEAAGLDQFAIGTAGGDGVRSPARSGNRRIEEAVASSSDLQAARECVGVFGTGMMEHIVIQGMTIASWAEAKGESEHVGKGVLKMVLTRLAEFWQAHDAASWK